MSFRFILQKIVEIYIFVITKNTILMTTSWFFLTFYYVIAIWCFHLHVLISELIHSKSALKTQCFRAEKIRADSELILSETVLFSTEFLSCEQTRFKKSKLISSESTLKNVKSLKPRYSALIISGTSNLVSQSWIRKIMFPHYKHEIVPYFHKRIENLLL